MAAVNEVLNGTNTTSSTFTPTDSISEVHVEPHEGGFVTLEALVPGGSWGMNEIFTGQGSVAISTPDGSVTYRFVATRLTEDVRVYMGP